MILTACGAQPEPVTPTPDPAPVPEDNTPEPDPEPMPWDFFALNKFTGEYDLDKEFAGTRPIAVSVNNIDHCLPQRGIADCDMFVEIEVEGGITRTMAFFADYRKIDQVGPVRSLRNQFLDLARPLDAMIVHIGSSAYADNAIYKYGYKTLDAMGCSIVFQDKSRVGKYDSEHTWYTDAEHISSCIESRQMRVEDSSPDPVFNFASYGTEAELTGGNASGAKWAFSDKYDCEIRYNKDSDTYELWQHGKLRYDEYDNKTLSFSNVFVIVASRPGYYGAGVPRYDYAAGGTGYYFSKGKYQEFTWSKDTDESRMIFKDLSGSELVVNTGKSYIAIINTNHADTISFES